MSNSPFDLNATHRWFAIELNNRAWDLVEAAGRTPEETERMIQAAHAACWHWLQIGQPINHLRAEVLLATAYVKAGLAEGAVRYAEKCLELSQQLSDAQTPFDRATVYGAAALAYRLADQLDQAQRRADQLHAIARDIESDEERALLAKLYGSAE